VIFSGSFFFCHFCISLMGKKAKPTPNIPKKKKIHSQKIGRADAHGSTFLRVSSHQLQAVQLCGSRTQITKIHHGIYETSKGFLLAYLLRLCEIKKAK
jgi:cobalamin biosynthesis protein CbiD